jgi:hypothetical protein
MTVSEDGTCDMIKSPNLLTSKGLSRKREKRNRATERHINRRVAREASVGCVKWEEWTDEITAARTGYELLE